MSLNIPEFMPILSAGSHAGPQDGACIMEYASFLNGEEWTDFPSCTNRILASIAQCVNDDLDGESRQSLLPLLPRLMGTGPRDEAPVETSTAIGEAAVRHVQPLVGHPNFDGQGLDWAAQAGLDLAHDPSRPSWAADSAYTAVRLAGGDQIAFLSALIDAYDKAVGRTAPATVTEDDLRRCAELTGAKA